MSTPNSPWDHPEPRGLSAVVGMLRVVVAVQCWGAAAQLLQPGGTSSELSRYLFASLEATSPLPQQFDRIAGLALLAAGLVTLVRPMSLIMLAIIGWFGAQLAGPLLHSNPRLTIDVLEQLIRIGAPLALTLTDWWPPKLAFSLGRFLFALWMLRMTAALSLLGQAGRALLLMEDRPAQVTIAAQCVAMFTGETWSDLRLSAAVSATAGMDLAIAIALITNRSRFSLLISAVWITVRISFWTLALGPDGYAESLVRSGLPGAPLVLLVFSLLAVRESERTIMPAEQGSSVPGHNGAHGPSRSHHMNSRQQPAGRH